MDPNIFSFVHVTSVICLVGLTFAACASPEPVKRKQVMMWSGIASVVALVTGFGLAGIKHGGAPAWIWIKLVAWLGVSVLAGMAFKKPEDAGKYTMIAVVLVAVATATVYFMSEGTLTPPEPAE